jgi:beta-lactamase class A
MMKNTRLFLAVACLLVGAAVTWGVERYVNHTSNQEANEEGYQFKRVKGYTYIQPLQYVDSKKESEEYAQLKNRLENSIDSLKNIGQLNDASIYLRDFEKGGWMSINSSHLFHPGSLLKLGAMISILQRAQTEPGLLQQTVTYQPTGEAIPTQSFNSKCIQLGKSYTVEQLLEYMIAYSDNNATSLLHGFIDHDKYLENFRTLNIPEPNGTNKLYQLKASEISNIFKVLYNGTMLSPEMSEKAIEILMKSDFKMGMSAGLPSSVPIAHKFGEFGGRNNQHELHEMGLVYLKNKPYILTIMTSGNQVKDLTHAIALITKQAFQNLLNSNK